MEYLNRTEIHSTLKFLNFNIYWASSCSGMCWIPARERWKRHWPQDAYCVPGNINGQINSADFCKCNKCYMGCQECVEVGKGNGRWVAIKDSFWEKAAANQNMNRICHWRAEEVCSRQKGQCVQRLGGTGTHGMFQQLQADEHGCTGGDMEGITQGPLRRSCWGGHARWEWEV